MNDSRLPKQATAAHFKLVDNAQARIQSNMGYIFSSLLETHTTSVKICLGLFSIKRTSISSADTTRRAKTIIGTSIIVNTASQNEPIFARFTFPPLPNNSAGHL